MGQLPARSSQRHRCSAGALGCGDSSDETESLTGSSLYAVMYETGAPVEGIDVNGGAFTPFQFDGRLFLMVPGGEEDGYATQLYELVDGRATPYVKLPGWSYQFVKLR